MELFDRVILASQTKQRPGLTMNELIDANSNAVGDWPRDSWGIAMFAAKGHMDRLELLNGVLLIHGTRPGRREIV